MYIDYLWEIDLVDVARIKEFSDGYTFCWCVLIRLANTYGFAPLKETPGKKRMMHTCLF